MYSCMYSLVENSKLTWLMLQKLLLLPELDDKITDSNDDNDKLATAGQSYSFNAMPVLNQINEELINDGSLPSRVVPRIMVNNVIASWSQVVCCYSM